MLGESITMREGLVADIAMKPLSDMVFAVSPKLFLSWELSVTPGTW